MIKISEDYHLDAWVSGRKLWLYHTVCATDKDTNLGMVVAPRKCVTCGLVVDVTVIKKYRFIRETLGV